MIGRPLRKSDLAIVKAVIRRYRAEGIDPGMRSPYFDPGRASSEGTAAAKLVQRLREDGGL